MSQPVLAVLVCCVVPSASVAAEYQFGYSVTYAGGSLPNVKGGAYLKLYIDSREVRLFSKTGQASVIPTSAITEVSYGQDVHHRVGTGAAIAVFSLGIGAMVAASESKKHYIGIMWANGDDKGGIALQADKNEYRGLLGALQGVTGRTAVDADAPQPNTQEMPAPPSREEAMPQPAAATETSKSITVRFTSTPTSAEVDIDGEYWGTTPTAEITRLPAGPHTIVVRKLGYQRWERKFTLAPGDDRTVAAELQQTNDASKPRISGIENDKDNEE